MNNLAKGGVEVWWSKGGVVVQRRCGAPKVVGWSKGGGVVQRRWGGPKEVWWSKEVW